MDNTDSSIILESSSIIIPKQQELLKENYLSEFKSDFAKEKVRHNIDAVEEANKDDKYYARKNGKWQEIFSLKDLLSKVKEIDKEKLNSITYNKEKKNYLKFWKGTKDQYNQLKEIDENTLYIII